MIIDHILAHVREQRLILTEEGLVWILPGAMPESLTLLELAYHTEEVKRLMAEGDVRLCPDQDLHRNEFYHVSDQVYRCAICKRIRESIKGEHP